MLIGRDRYWCHIRITDEQKNIADVQLKLQNKMVLFMQNLEVANWQLWHL